MLYVSLLLETFQKFLSHLQMIEVQEKIELNLQQ